ncbi:MAG TPA: helix-turn-helix domain-containing protein [Verrucomicrobiales bacterium]|nr:helix-turn-helix domain-containing protein [Verrucomicrobiales bacterium]
MLRHEKQTAIAAATSAATHAPQLPPRFLKVASAVPYCGLGRSTLYELLSEGKIKSHRIGGARVIDRESLDAYITSQPA